MTDKPTDKVTKKHLIYAIAGAGFVIAYAVVGELILKIDQDTLVSWTVIISITIATIACRKSKK